MPDDRSKLPNSEPRGTTTHVEDVDIVLTKPRHIAEANIADPRTCYLWDEWNVTAAYQPADKERTALFARFSHRANVGICIAIAEWIVWRFEGLDNDPMPLQYLEAAWAANVHLAYAKYIETDDDQWRGAVRGPINIAMSIVIDLLWEDGVIPGEHASWMDNLARLVLSNQEPYEAWLKACANRLNKLELPELEQDDYVLGDVVPRELFDTNRPFNPNQTITLVDGFLRALDFSDNPYLRSPDEMLKRGDFSGKPYRVSSP